MSLPVCDLCGSYISKRYKLVPGNLSDGLKKLPTDELYSLPTKVSEGQKFCRECLKICKANPENCLLTVTTNSGVSKILKSNDYVVNASINKDDLLLNAIEREKNKRPIYYPPIPSFNP